MARLCVVMCTYDGERFLDEQLRSIAQQACLPDSMVIVDDRSTDSTAAIARSFAAAAPFPVRVIDNPENLGYVRNFERAIREADGELVVLADQDDVWKENRLGEIRRTFEQWPAAGAAFSDAELVDAALHPLGTKLSEAVGFTPAQQRLALQGATFDVLLKGNVVTGATLAFRGEYRELVLPMSAASEHDAWIALLIAAVAPVVFIPRPLILYRQHGGNQIGAAKLSLLERIRRARRQRVAGLVQHRERLGDVLERLESVPLEAGRRERIRQAMAHLDVRSGLSDRRYERALPVLREIATGRYRRMSHGLASAWRDLLA